MFLPCILRQCNGHQMIGLTFGCFLQSAFDLPGRTSRLPSQINTVPAAPGKSVAFPLSDIIVSHKHKQLQAETAELKLSCREGKF